MSWQVAAFAIVFVALAGGLFWYERTRPSSRMLALVASMAALAALGRIAFAPLPDVKPTTAIVLACGYTLGAAPGFAVGATAALASNLFFGQGPWTPWQMLGWGLVGLLGAVLASATGRRCGPITLALASGAGAAAFGLLQDFSTWITYTGDLTLSRFLLIEGAALPFNIVHVVSSVLFFLAFGPTLVRMLERFRTRLSFVWLPLAALAAALVLGLAGTALASPTAGPLAYLAFSQDAGGGYGAAPGAPASQLYTAWAVMGMAAARGDAYHRERAVHYMLANLSSLSGTGDDERTVLALAAAGSRPPRNLLQAIDRAQRDDGSFGEQVNLTAFGIFAERATHGSSRRVSAARAWLARQQGGDGGFGFAARGAAEDIDDTAAALEALVAAGASRHGAVARAASYLAGRQNADGGFPLEPGRASNGQSTAWAVQAFIAAGHSPASVHRRGSRSAVGYLESLIAPNGAVRYSRTSAQTPVWVTGQALTALAGRPLPIGP